MFAVSRIFSRLVEARERVITRTFGITNSRMSPEPNGSVTSQSPSGVAKGKSDAPVKFTTSEANVRYKATRNFYGDDRDLPPSHNKVLAATFIFATYYLIYLRDDIEGGGGKELFKPIHDQVPELAIPLLQTAIEENKKFGNDTHKLEKRLTEYVEAAEKHGYTKRRLIEN